MNLTTITTTRPQPLPSVSRLKTDVGRSAQHQLDVGSGDASRYPSRPSSSNNSRKGTEWFLQRLLTAIPSIAVVDETTDFSRVDSTRKEPSLVRAGSLDGVKEEGDAGSGGGAQVRLRTRPCTHSCTCPCTRPCTCPCTHSCTRPCTHSCTHSCTRS
jgi:hypothetical protein